MGPTGRGPERVRGSDPESKGGGTEGCCGKGRWGVNGEFGAGEVSSTSFGVLSGGGAGA